MKILFDHPLLFALAQGEQQIQIEQTRAALPAIGIEVELVRQWHARQGGNQIRCFGAARYA